MKRDSRKAVSFLFSAQGLLPPIYSHCSKAIFSHTPSSNTQKQKYNYLHLHPDKYGILRRYSPLWILGRTPCRDGNTLSGILTAPLWYASWSLLPTDAFPAYRPDNRVHPYNSRFLFRPRISLSPLSLSLSPSYMKKKWH